MNGQGRAPTRSQALFDAVQPLLQLAVILWLLFIGITAPAAPETLELGTTFQRSIADAALRLDRNVHGGLVPVTPTNDDLTWRDSVARDTLAVVAFVSTGDADTIYRNPDGTPRTGVTPADTPRVWVSLAPELRRFCQRLDIDDPTQRLRQYLGLDPAGKYERLVEMYVSRDDLFRPCPDPEVDDTVCTLSSADSIPTVKNIANYREFLLSVHEKSYHRDGAPWTGLGYTYDWAHGERGIGASEYMLVPNAGYRVLSVDTPARYCAGG